VSVNAQESPGGIVEDGLSGHVAGSRVPAANAVAGTDLERASAPRLLKAPTQITAARRPARRAVRLGRARKCCEEPLTEHTLADLPRALSPLVDGLARVDLASERC